MGKPLSDEEITEAIRDKGGCFAFGKWALATIEALRNQWCDDMSKAPFHKDIEVCAKFVTFDDYESSEMCGIAFYNGTQWAAVYPSTGYTKCIPTRWRLRSTPPEPK